MARIKLLKTRTVVRPCELTQFDEDGKAHQFKVRIRFVVISREQWEAMTNSDDDRLLYDVVVDRIEDEIEGDDGSVLTPEDAKAAIRGDLSLTAQVVDHFMELNFGAAAKNARRSRAR
ncbi:hypothetical protein [Vulcaniibacterium tengchongense]|uniref:Tail assembly chaperone n=1 Tax=Vulcaniibacterium tengchongense TaxID=1273429 RepID=A0A3N4VXJ8_9GAMM|nr:hypothetical protein [Vulcaniibacterium tengchongense]RPE81847.1 hypothetical protein EDC50_1049 [Vulcaniibacterium tengchongense]